MKYKARIAVFGGREITDDIYKDTVIIGEKLAKRGYLVYCGGGEGVMEAICRGVTNENGISIGLLKGSDSSEANKYLSIPIVTNMGITRNSLIAMNADIALAIAGNYGTLSEIAYALQLEIPVIGYKTWDISGVKLTSSLNEIFNLIDDLL
jgi:uncharacterized protein (TIGR00725 family)